MVAAPLAPAGLLRFVVIEVVGFDGAAPDDA
jgi:hypothetical protein